jgi:pyruvate dehydrogenase E2 component (dihydrolipoamide acetyltransferase)
MTPDAKPAEAGDRYQVVMPKLGLTMTEATLAEWLKADGDSVAKGEPLFVLESEKSTLEIEAPAGGILHVLVAAGQTVPVHTPIADLVREPGIAGRPPEPRIEEVGPGARESEPATRPECWATMHGSRIPASPKARALARRLGVSLAGIAGSGVRDMVVVADVERAHALRGAAVPGAVDASPVARRLAARTGVDLAAVAGSGPGGRIMRRDVEAAGAAGGPAPSPPPPEGEAVAPGVQPLTGLRAVIAERLSASWRERPHVTLTTEADATNLVSARQQAIAETGIGISYDAFFVALAARALREQPGMNVRLAEGGIERLAEINVGVAVDTERGLLVPVVRDAASRSLLQVQRVLAELVERARAGRSLPDDLSGGTFTITNLGRYEIDAFTPIINPPESAILGVGRIVAKPVARPGGAGEAADRQVVVRDMMTLSLSFDHRLVDGAPAARFLQRVKQLVERPFSLALGAERANGFPLARE